VAAVILLMIVAPLLKADQRLVDYVSPFLGTAPLTNVDDIGFEPPWRVWTGLTFPGASLPNAMVQLSPITEFGSGAGYEYEHQTIFAFVHTNKGHWNMCHIPLFPVAGDVDATDFGSPFSHDQESASPGYYQVFLKRYNINAELTTTRRCGYHRYTYKSGPKHLIANLAMSNERVRDWTIERNGDNAFEGYQTARERVYFYATVNHRIRDLSTLGQRRRRISLITFDDADQPLEIKIGISFVSTENAKLNLEAELSGRSFEQIKAAASQTWDELLSKITVSGGSERQKCLFYSCLYRSFLWPALRSDVNGEFLDESGMVVRKNFDYYTTPALWDDYRNKLVLLQMLLPKVAEDIIQSMIDRGGVTGFMPTFFHGDHAAPFISGAYSRGLRGFDVDRAYQLLLKNATVESRRARPHLAEYIKNGFVSTPVVISPAVETSATAGVTKTLEYAYDDYAVALLARVLNDDATYQLMMKRARNYANVFDPSTRLMRGRLENGDWVEPFDPQQPYYEYMYREANAWQSTFFAPHDTEGLISLYPSREAFEQQLDRLFSIPWDPNHIARNINSFIGQYCHGNQPDHGFPYLYYWVGKQEKSQAILNTIMERFYGMDDGLTLCGMDDAGEMSSWYVFNAIGIYPYSPADEDYIICVPVFDEVKMKLNGKMLTISRANVGPKISKITYGGDAVDGYFIPHHDLAKGKQLVIKTVSSSD
jgi:predicted alpha-1,2-mannosidase